MGQPGDGLKWPAQAQRHGRSQVSPSSARAAARSTRAWDAPRRLAVFLSLGIWLAHLAAAAPPRYEPRLWNRSCNYTVTNIPAETFFKGHRGSSASTSSSGPEDMEVVATDSTEPLFPISPGYRVAGSEDGSLTPVQAACFGPGHRVNHTLVAAGLKMPCGYVVKPGALVDYWEEAACELALKANCYSYALNQQGNRGYSIPGFNTADSIEVDYSDCMDAITKVQMDGGVPASREQVYATVQPEHGHYIALVVWPGRDFHFFRRDAEGWWSQKRGDTFVTNTYPNGTAVADVEDPAILGAYRQFCGYFQVTPREHDDADSGWTYSSVPARLRDLADIGLPVTSTPLAHPSVGWMRLNYPYLLFGLDAAVFESGERQLPWQSDNRVVTEAGSRVQKAAHAAVQASSSSSQVKPHWLSHAQHRTTVQQRDRAVREHYAKRARQV